MSSSHSPPPRHPTPNPEFAIVRPHAAGLDIHIRFVYLRIGLQEEFTPIIHSLGIVPPLLSVGYVTELPIDVRNYVT